MSLFFKSRQIFPRESSKYAWIIVKNIRNAETSIREAGRGRRVQTIWDSFIKKTWFTINPHAEHDGFRADPLMKTDLRKISRRTFNFSARSSLDGQLDGMIKRNSMNSSQRDDPRIFPGEIFNSGNFQSYLLNQHISRWFTSYCLFFILFVKLWELPAKPPKGIRERFWLWKLRARRFFMRDKNDRKHHPFVMEEYHPHRISNH